MSCSLQVTVSITAAEFHRPSCAAFCCLYSSNNMSLEMAVAPDLTSASYLDCTSSVSAAFAFLTDLGYSSAGSSGRSLMSMSLSFFSAADFFTSGAFFGFDSSN